MLHALASEESVERAISNRENLEGNNATYQHYKTSSRRLDGVFLAVLCAKSR